MPKLKLYVGCALSEAPPEFRDSVEELKKSLEPEYEVLKFLGLVDGTPTDVFRKDVIQNVGTCDLMLAVCDYPSTGLGWELCEAVKIRKVPVLGVALSEKKVTRFLPGIAGHYPNFTIERYKNLLEDVPKLLDAFVEKIFEDMLDNVGVPHGLGHGTAVGLDDDPV